MGDDWLTITGFDAWSTKLQELMDEADAAVRSQVGDRIATIAGRLRDFRRYSPTPSCDELDKLANRALEGLVRSVVSESVQILHEASSELDALIKQLRAVTAETNLRAGWLSLKTPAAIADRLDDTVGAMTSLYETTEGFQNAVDLKARIDAAVRAVERLRDEVRKAL